MSQVTPIQVVAGMQLFGIYGCMTTRSEFTERFNKTFGTNHDEIDFAITFDELEEAGAISQFENTPEGSEPLFIAISDNFNEIMLSYIRKAMRVEASRTRAYWERH